MYQIVFEHDYSGQFFKIGEPVSSLSEAIKERKMSGDLIVDLTSGELVQDSCILFDWEKKDEKCYARERMETFRFQKINMSY